MVIANIACSPLRAVKAKSVRITTAGVAAGNRAIRVSAVVKRKRRRLAEVVACCPCLVRVGVCRRYKVACLVIWHRKIKRAAYKGKVKHLALLVYLHRNVVGDSAHGHGGLVVKLPNVNLNVVGKQQVVFLAGLAVGVVFPRVVSVVCVIVPVFFIHRLAVVAVSVVVVLVVQSFHAVHSYDIAYRSRDVGACVANSLCHAGVFGRKVKAAYSKASSVARFYLAFAQSNLHISGICRRILIEVNRIAAG